MLKKRAILKFRKEGLTYKEIGLKFEPPISKQRVHQIIADYHSPYYAHPKKRYPLVKDEKYYARKRAYEKEHRHTKAFRKYAREYMSKRRKLSQNRLDIPSKQR